MSVHIPKDKVERDYNRAAFMERRIEIVQEWADMLSVRLTAPMVLLDGKRR